MTTAKNSASEPAKAGAAQQTKAHDFEDSERLRSILTRLHEEGHQTSQRDPEITALMRHAAQRYASLARAHGLDPWEAATAAYDAMRTKSARQADDPWAVITRAVQVTCIAEERATGLLCSVHQARRAKYSAYHDAERLSDRDNPLTDYHPRFHVPDSFTRFDAESDDAEQARVREAIENAGYLFHVLGWPEETARSGIDFICTRLADSASRAAAFESLRRDYQARVLLDVPTESWLVMLRLILGNPSPAKSYTASARGVLFRLLSGEPLEAVFADLELMTEIVMSAPEDRTAKRG